MRKKTVYSNWEWKQITGEMPIQINVWVDKGNGCSYLQGQFQADRLDQLRVALAPFIKASNRKTRQGILFDIIRSGAPREIVRNALGLYQGFSRGFKLIVDMVEAENNRLFELFPDFNPEDPFFWGLSNKTNIESLIDQFGWMQTDQAHEYLVKLASESYHPLTQAYAIQAMAWEDDRFDAQFILDLIRNPKTPIRHIYEALYAIAGHSDRYKGVDYCPAIWPFVKHSDSHIYREAILAIRFKYGGRQRLRKYLDHLKKDPDTNLKKIEEIESGISGWEEEDAEVAERIAARKAKEIKESLENS